MEELFELAIKVSREEIPENFDEYRRFVVETPDGELAVVSRSEYVDAARRLRQAGLKAGMKK